MSLYLFPLFSTSLHLSILFLFVLLLSSWSPVQSFQSAAFNVIIRCENRATMAEGGLSRWILEMWVSLYHTGLSRVCSIRCCHNANMWLYTMMYLWALWQKIHHDVTRHSCSMFNSSWCVGSLTNWKWDRRVVLKNEPLSICWIMLMFIVFKSITG